MAVRPVVGATVYHPAYRYENSLQRWFVAEAVVETIGPERVRGEDLAGTVKYVGPTPASGGDRILAFDKAFATRDAALAELRDILQRSIANRRRELDNTIANLDALPREPSPT